MGLQLGGMGQPCRRQHFRQRNHGVAVEVIHPLGFVRHHQRALAQWILGSDAGRAAIGMAGPRLDTANGEHEAPRGIDPVGAYCQHRGDIEGADDLAAGTDADLIP